MSKQISFTQSTSPGLVATESIKLLLKTGLIIPVFIFYFIGIPMILYVNLAEPVSGISEEIKAEMNESLRPLYIILIVIPVVVFFLWYSIKKRFSKPKNARFITNVKYDLTPESITRSGEGFSVTTRWEDLYRIKEKAKHFLIFVSKGELMIIGKTTLSTSEKEDVRELFNSIRNKVKVSLK